jgi:hypothetical protein
MITFPEGPYLAMACLCEHILEEKDNVMSAIRIVDRYELTVPSEAVDNSDAVFPLDINGLISFKSGGFKGQKELTITLINPSGEKPGNPFKAQLRFEGNEHGANVKLRFTLPAKEQGVYWLNIELDGELMSRIPLRIIITQKQPEDKQAESLKIAEPTEQPAKD